MSRSLLLAALLAFGCGKQKGLTTDGGSDAGDAAVELREEVAEAGDAWDGEGGDGSDPGLPALVPPKVDCTPYGEVPNCALRVAPGGQAGNDGLTWATALADVQDALDLATCGCTVWIAAGSYLPARGPDATDPDPRARSFMVWSNIQVFGGFAGNEDSLEARTPGHETILSGDLGDLDVRDDNTYHVVWPGTGSSLQSVTVSGGHANGFNVGQGVGAGIFMVGVSVSLANVSVTDNDAGSGGGVWADDESELAVVGGSFARNVADVGGGIGSSAKTTTIADTLFYENVGVFIGGAVASQSPVLRVDGATFTRNRGDFGASVALSAGDGVVNQCWFEGNVAGLFGGALFLRLGSHARLTNSVVVANASIGHGGGLTVWTAKLDVDFTTIVGNSATFGGAVLVKDGARFSLTDSVLWRNSDDTGKTFFLEGADNEVSITSSDLPPEVSATTSFDEDPLLGNVPLGTRFAESKGSAADQMTLAQADQHFAVGDRIELGDDGVERHVTAVTSGAISFTPAWATQTPRFLRVDRWAASAPSLTLNLVPTAASPLKDAASMVAFPADALGKSRDGKADIGALEFR
jgi:hypothetical protein